METQPSEGPVDTERVSASRVIPASADSIFAVLTDADGHVAMDSSGMLQGATGDAVTTSGDSFVVHTATGPRPIPSGSGCSR